MLSALIRTAVEAVVAWILVTFTIFLTVVTLTGYSTGIFWYNADLSPGQQDRAHESALRETDTADDAIAQYSQWISAIGSGDFGQSSTFRRPVADLIGERLEATSELLWIGLGASLLGMIFASARRESTLTLAISRTIGAALPAFWVALVLILWLGVQAGMFPLAGRFPLGLGGDAPPLEDRLEYIAIPAIVLFIYAQGRFSLVLPKQGSGFRGSARAFASEVPGLIATIVVIETIFAWPGLGRFLIEALLRQDLQASSAALVVLATLLIAAGALFRFFAAIPDKNDRVATLRVNRDAIPVDSISVITEEPQRTSSSPVQTSRSNEGIGSYRVLLFLLMVFTVFAYSESALTDALDLKPTSVNPRNTFLSPGETRGGQTYVLGTDELGRDLLARVIAGAQNSLITALSVAAVAVIAGFVLARVLPVPILRSVASVFYFTPALVIVVVLLGLFRQQENDLIPLIAGVFIIPSALYLFRQPVVKMLPVFGLMTAQALLAEGMISFLELGIQLPAPSLGNLLTNVQSALLNGQHLLFVPGIALAALAFLLLASSYNRLPNEPLYRA